MVRMLTLVSKARGRTLGGRQGREARDHQQPQPRPHKLKVAGRLAFPLMDKQRRKGR